MLGTIAGSERGECVEQFNSFKNRL